MITVNQGGVASLVLGAATETIISAPSNVGAVEGTAVGSQSFSQWILIATNAGANPATVRVYKYAGPNCGFREVSGLTGTLAAAGDVIIEFDNEAGADIKITATSTLGTTVSSDLRAVRRSGD